MPTTRSGANGSQSSMKLATRAARKRAGIAKPTPAARRRKVEKLTKSEKTLKGHKAVQGKTGQPVQRNGKSKGPQKRTEELKKTAGNGDSKESEKNEFEMAKADTDDVMDATEGAPKNEQATTSQSVIEGKNHEAAMPSSILEKGVIYFFRSRVNVEEPHGIEDVARGYIILRPLSLEAKLSEGLLGDTDNTRLLVLPKKALPKGHSDRFPAFVEKARISVKELKEKFVSGNDYVTKTAG
jgi:hypothetical protein